MIASIDIISNDGICQKAISDSCKFRMGSFGRISAFQVLILLTKSDFRLTLAFKVQIEYNLLFIMYYERSSVVSITYRGIEYVNYILKDRFIFKNGLFNVNGINLDDYILWINPKQYTYIVTGDYKQIYKDTILY
ncbi:hypothetical protein WA158_002252 [Blastocystis sp. Blastoise]